MPTIALQAHYDGKHVVLDEAYDLPNHASLMLTVLSAVPEAEVALTLFKRSTES